MLQTRSRWSAGAFAIHNLERPSESELKDLANAHLDCGRGRLAEATKLVSSMVRIDGMQRVQSELYFLAQDG